MATEPVPTEMPDAESTPGPTFLLVDLSSIAYPTWHTSQSEPDPNATSTRIVARVRSLATAHPHAAICVDSGRSFRAEIDPTYKAQRPESEAALHHQIGLAIDILRGDGFPVWAVKGFEADDIIATACARAMQIDGARVVIASGDKDLLQLVTPRVVAKSLKDGALIDEDAVLAKFGVLPHQMRDYLSLCGDASDNIKGANRIGPKGAVKLISAYHSLDSAYRAIDEGKAGDIPPAIRASLAEFRPRLETVRSLVTMRVDVPIPFEEVLEHRVPKDIETFNFSEEDEMEDVIEVTPEAVPGEHNNGNGSTGTAMVRAEATSPAPAEWERQLDPRSMRDAMQLAKDMHNSRLFSDYGSPQAVLATVLAGRELGMQAMASLRAFHVIEGKPRLAADLLRAIVIQSGKAKYFRCSERTPERATFETQRGDDPPITLTYTVQEGRAAFSGKQEKWDASGWGKNPADMCVARAGSKLARLVYPDVVHGLIAKEEFD